MPFLHRGTSCVALFGLLITTCTYAQVSSINSAVITSRVFNDVPGATYTGVNSYPGSVLLSESGVSASTGFANRDTWQFSNNGISSYAFQHDDYFFASFDLTLTADPISPRKEAGFILSTISSGDIQFEVNTDGHEVVQFGGISFYSFNATNGLTYNSGQTITMGMKYFLDGSGNNALQFFADSYASPIFEFGPSVGSGAPGIDDGSILRGYFQIVNAPAIPSNSGTALFENISISPVVPEPSMAALLGLGVTSLLLRRKR